MIKFIAGFVLGIGLFSLLQVDVHFIGYPKFRLSYFEYLQMKENCAKDATAYSIGAWVPVEWKTYGHCNQVR